MWCGLRLMAAVWMGIWVGSALGEAPKSVPAKQVSQPAVAATTALASHVLANSSEDGLHVHLMVDGNFAGRAFVLDGLGKPRPVRARIALVRGGQVVASTQADEWGRYQIVGVQPGVYSVLAAANDYVAAATVHVLAFEPNGANNPAMLSISLLPSSEIQMLKAMMGPVAPAAAAVPAATPAAGAATGGAAAVGGGMGGMLGAAGAGLGAAGLAGGGGEGGAGGNGGAASQFVPTVSTSANTGGGAVMMDSPTFPAK